MLVKKAFAITIVFLFVLSGPSFGQGIPHIMPPMPAPTVQAPVIPNMPIPGVPHADASVSVAALNAENIREVESKIESLKNEIAELEAIDQASKNNLFTEGDGSLAEASYYIAVHKYNIQIALKDIDHAKQILAESSSEYAIKLYEGKIRGLENSIAQREAEIEKWQPEYDSRKEKQDENANKLKEKKEELADAMAELDALKGASTAQTEEPKKEETEENKEVVNASDLNGDETLKEDDKGVSGDTADITPEKTLQELREDAVREAFEDIDALDFQIGVLEKVDTGGKIVQTAIGFVPGMEGADVGLAALRGFGESMGEEIAKGTSWADSLKIASANAGFNTVVAIVGNKLTAGADKLANRVVVLTEAGMSKLTTKQMAEMGGKGISFLVIKSGQALGGELTGETVGKSLNKAVSDSVKDKKKDKKSTGSGLSSSGSGYGTSTATQPHAAY